LRVLQTVLLVTGSTLLVVYAAAQVDSARGRERALEVFAEARAGEAVAPAPQASTEAAPAALEYPHEPDQSLWGTARITAYRDSLHEHAATPLGVLTIASIELEAPIFDGTSDVTLNRGIGRIDGTAELDAAGNVGLAGHRDGFFRALKDVHVGDAIKVESLVGTMHYRIAELMIVEPTDVYVLEPTDEATLTLVTCYPFYFIGEAPQRYIVKAVAEISTAGVSR
jgi:sortase A